MKIRLEGDTEHYPPCPECLGTVWLNLPTLKAPEPELPHWFNIVLGGLMSAADMRRALGFPPLEED